MTLIGRERMERVREVIREKYKRNGYIIMKTSSYSEIADFIAINEKEVLFVQVRYKSFRKATQSILESNYSWINGMKECKFIIEK